MVRLGKSKKGSIQDIIMIAALLLFVSISILIGFKITSDWTSTVNTMDDVPANAKASNTKLTGYYTGIIDDSFLLVFIFSSIVTLIMAAMVECILYLFQYFSLD